MNITVVYVKWLYGCIAFSHITIFFSGFNEQKLTKKEGFTLIELAIVLVVIGLLVGLGSSLIGTNIKTDKGC